ncbi:MAG: alpha/beta hydrolase [Deltaproteobacteria bacterium]|nr:alpha/beta hydrolase [Deltaproteobacteria bacterium]
MPLESTFVQAGSVRLHVVRAGPRDGRPVLLLHGFPEFWYGWRRQIPALARHGLRVLGPDQRGYNLSDRPRAVAEYRFERLVGDVLALLDAEGLEQVVLVGHDWGAAVAWGVAARAPERVTHLAILNVPHPDVLLRNLRRNPRQLMRSWYVLFFQLPWLPDALLARDRGALLARLLRASSRRGSFTEEDLAHYREAFARPGAVTAMLAWYRAFLRYRPEALPSPIRPPTLVLWGARDTALGREMVQPSVERCERGEAVFLERATHWVQHDAADEVNQRLLAFFDTAM